MRYWTGKFDLKTQNYGTLENMDLLATKYISDANTFKYMNLKIIYMNILNVNCFKQVTL